jgi:hypothetical protein
MSEPDDDRAELKPIYVSSLREMKLILVTWIVSFVWVVAYCYAFGYSSSEGRISTTWGIPSWAFWGIFVPWVVTAVVTSWFAMRFMEDHPLEDPEDQERIDG